MSSIIVVKTYEKDTRQVVEGILVTLGGGYGEIKTNKKGKAIFEIPDGINYIDVYVSGSFVKNHYVTDGDLNVFVSSTGYFEEII